MLDLFIVAVFIVLASFVVSDEAVECFLVFIDADGRFVDMAEASNESE